MPHYIMQNRHMTPVLVYEAPVDEKTKKVREMFDVDEKTGYPRHYNWRLMARLGQSYRPEDPFLKFDAYDPQQSMTSNAVICGVFAIGAAAAHYYTIHCSLRPWWSKPWMSLLSGAASAGIYFYVSAKSHERHARRDAIYVDYLQKHPERFETIYRPKVREVLFSYTPVR